MIELSEVSQASMPSTEFEEIAMTSKATEVRTETKPARIPLCQRNPADVNTTVLRVIGKAAKIDQLDVAAFQSFAD